MAQPNYVWLKKNYALRLLKTSLSFSAAVFLFVGCSAGDGTGLDTQGRPISGGGGSTIKPGELFTPREVQNIFNANCIICHSGADAPAGMSLAESESYDNIVSIRATQQNLNRIEPGDPDKSYLIQKVLPNGNHSGVRMPANGLYLSNAEIQVLIDWVDEGAPSGTEESGVVIDDTSFKNYMQWQVVDYASGATNRFLADRHDSDKNDFFRRVYANGIATNSNGTLFEEGAILVKETFNYVGGEKTYSNPAGLLAMVKREPGFAPDFGDWEWFFLNPENQTIKKDESGNALRSAELNQGGCRGCHSAAENDIADSSNFGSKDFVFTHPSEFIAENVDFADYQNWDLIDERNEENELLGGFAHGVQGDTVRRVYKNKIYANAMDESTGYPVGTIFVKEVVSADGVQAITAMAKRGGNSNPDFGNWEWFFLDPSTGEIAMDDAGDLRRGVSLNNNGCNNCHSQARQTSGHGIDYVFKHSADPFNNNAEFFADINSFLNYSQWNLVDYSIGPVNAAIGGGHQGQNNEYARKVYANALAQRAINDGANVFEKGSIFVKEVLTWDESGPSFSPAFGLVAMVKRGEQFNASHAGWDWFILEPDLSQVISRGGNLNNGGCNNCHASATGDVGFDYVFKHASEFVAPDDHFSDYESWELIDERSDRNPLLGATAHKADDPITTRKIYKLQSKAKLQIVNGEQQYPIGTTIVKEVIKEGEIVELLAMVKRGNGFDAEFNDWEWFLLDPQDASIRSDEEDFPLRGADLMGGGCRNCHSAANQNEQGADFVFIHPDDPVNKF